MAKKSAGAKPGRTQTRNRHQVSAVTTVAAAKDNERKIASACARTPATFERRLKSAAKEAFQSMGED